MNTVSYPGQEPDLTRGVPPRQDTASFGTCFAIAVANTVNSESLPSTKTTGSPTTVFPVEHDRLGISASRKIGYCYGLVHTLYENLLLADPEIWPGIEPELAELIDYRPLPPSGSDTALGLD